MRKKVLYFIVFAGLAGMLLVAAGSPARAANELAARFNNSAARRSNHKPPPPLKPFVEKDVKVIRLHTGEVPGEAFGWLGTRLSDLNGDGVNDYLISAPNADNGNGRFTVYSGRDGAILNDVRGDARQNLGYSAANAGDVDGDGVDDYIVSGPLVDGLAVIYSGSTQQEIRRFTGSPGSAFGASASGAGDLNGDGYAEVIVGDPNEAGGAGAVLAYSGADGALMWTSLGSHPGGGLGNGLGPLGDVNEDGIPDVVASAPGAGAEGFGEAYVLSGQNGAVLLTVEPPGPPSTPSGTYGVFFTLGAGDIDQDGYPDFFVGDYAAEAGDGAASVYSGRTGAVLFHFAGKPGEGLGPGRPVEDLNGDGYLDFVIAGWTYGATQEGRAYIYSGKDGSILRTVTGTIPGDNLGVDALSLGDVNYDGRPDFLLTAVGLDFSGIDIGRSYVVTLAPFKKK
jgi:hypothetical protein